MEVPVLSRLNTKLRTSRISREFGIDALSDVLEAYLPDEEIQAVRRAHDFSARMHEGQFRKSGEPYIYHPLAVARILAEMRLDHTTLMAAILHDVIEDTPTAKDEIKAQFGETVADLVDGVSKLDRASDQSRQEAQAESLRKLLLAMTDDMRVILVKLADRLHNMRTLGSMDTDKRRRIARETLEIYAPMAHRLGIHTIRTELEDLGFANLYPQRYRVLSRSVSSVSGKRRNLIREVEERLSRQLKEDGIGAAVLGRRKNLHSIYLKMRNKHLRFMDVMDLYGFRVIVDSEDTCYRALGVVHSVFQPISEQFNDYIATPKINGYQSLHTTLVGPKGVKIEVQIRTRDMHHIAESGVAAHWLYKLGSRASKKAPEQRAREWLDGLMEAEGRATSDAVEFVENVRVDLFPDEVYVFTPKGRIVRLPKGATPVDFAYAVHTELGNRCVAARVDQQQQPISTVLVNGQQVEVITSRHQNPNATWLNFVKTGKARSAILYHLRHQRTDEARRMGRRLLEMALREIGGRRFKLDEDRLREVLAELRVKGLDQLYESIGMGKRLAPLVARQLMPSAPDLDMDEAAPLAIHGTEGLIVEFARCCRPIPGDPVRGHLSSGRGVVIHRSICRNSVSRKSRAREWIEVVWADDVQGEYPVELKIQGENKRGLLGRVATALADADCNIDNVRIADRSGELAELSLLVTVHDRRHLARMMRRIRQTPNVIRVARGGVDSGHRTRGQRPGH